MWKFVSLLSWPEFAEQSRLWPLLGGGNGDGQAANRQQTLMIRGNLQVGMSWNDTDKGHKNLEKVQYREY